MSDGWIGDSSDAVGTPEDLYLPELRRRVERRGDQTLELARAFATREAEVESILDLACGPGVHAVELANEGFSVRGIDVSRQYVEMARRNAAREGVSDRTDFVVGDMRDIDCDAAASRDMPKTFDAVTNRYNSFGYFSDRENRDVVAAVYDRLREAGVFVLELRNREWVAATADRHEVISLDGQERVARREYDPTTGRLTETVDVFEGEAGEHLGSYTTDTRLYSPVEMRGIFEQVGFETSLAGTLGGDPLTDHREWFVVFGVKN